MERVSTREPHSWVTEGWTKLRFGVGVTTRAPGAAWPVRRDLARAAEELGADSFWVPDHPVFAPDCWSQLATLAISTDRLRLGPLVSCAKARFSRT
jgi:alkanesulfonate monooxygenase SsuD/methylene tetrahydromethanopterin reductase-like flavin-dependent oxidoreductase (luciferase family)